MRRRGRSNFADQCCNATASSRRGCAVGRRKSTRTLRGHSRLALGNVCPRQRRRHPGEVHASDAQELVQSKSNCVARRRTGTSARRQSLQDAGLRSMKSFTSFACRQRRLVSPGAACAVLDRLRFAFQGIDRASRSRQARAARAGARQCDLAVSTPNSRSINSRTRLSVYSECWPEDRVASRP